MDLSSHDIDRLRSQMGKAELVLFTGAGFSLGAKNRSGQPMPDTGTLKQELWTLCFPNAEFDASTSLGDLYGTALRHHRRDLAQLLETCLAVDPDSLPEYYRTYFDLPWLRCYTLNVDDLELAVSSRFHLERPLLTITATSPESVQVPSPGWTRGGLEIVHLNGVVPGPAEKLTFSETQYAERIANQEPWYSRCVADLTCRPVVFIGTLLSESLLWQHIELRKKREPHGRDLRPTSILVTPSLTLPRQEILRDFRIEWVRGTAESFAKEVLPEVSRERDRGFAFIREYSEARSIEFIPLVSQLASERPSIQTEYLLGAEPEWADLIVGRAAERSHDGKLREVAIEILGGTRRNTALAVTGTAGTGKSTALMRLALRFSADGIPVLWLDKDSEVTPARIRKRVRATTGKIVLAFDDPDMYGREFVGLLRDLVPGSTDFLLAFAVRSGRLDDIVSPVSASGDLIIYEHVVPPLTDEDIGALVAVLDRHNRLGILKGFDHDQRCRAFREQAGRQMLVAMIQATSGQNFEIKAHDELTQLVAAQRYVYSLICTASSLRQFLTKDEILLACGDMREDALSALERLASRYLVTALPPAYRYRARHRVIADLVLDKLIELREVKNVMLGLAWAAASKVDPSLERKSRSSRFLAEVINHALLRRLVGVMEARDIYEELETILSWDYHYWLQRGSLEVEAGDIRLAESFLSTAYSLHSDDYRVRTAYAYMLMRKAWEAPQEARATQLLSRAMDMLEEVMHQRGDITAYPFHVMGSQGLAWVRRASLTREEKRTFLRGFLENLDQGLKLHPRKADLQHLRDDIQKELLMTAAVNPPSR